MSLYIPARLSLFAPMINRRANTNIHKKSSSRPKPAIAHCSEDSESEETSLLDYFATSLELELIWTKSLVQRKRMTAYPKGLKNCPTSKKRFFLLSIWKRYKCNNIRHFYTSKTRFFINSHIETRLFIQFQLNVYYYRLAICDWYLSCKKYYNFQPCCTRSRASLASWLSTFSPG